MKFWLIESVMMAAIFSSAGEMNVEPDYLRYYDVFPLTVAADKRATVTVRPRFGHARFTGELTVKVYPIDGRRQNGAFAYGGLDGVEFNLDDSGALRVTADFSGEQQFDIVAGFTRPATRWEPERRVERRFRVYSLAEDLRELRPFKGDFHMHSTGSDGVEAPEYVAVRCREEGFDFAALTDHYRYSPSLEAIRAVGAFPSDFKLFPGEEVHLPGNRVHIVNFGGAFSVNELAEKEPDKFRRETAERLAAITEITPENGGMAVAISEWAFDMIGKGGGVAMFCHPYWQTQGYDINEAVTSAILKRRKFDVFEVVGGFAVPGEWRSNNLQIARYYAEREAGNHFPVAGVSDGHGVDSGALFTWYYTIVLAKSDSFADIAAAIKAGNCVAVEAAQGSVPRVYGDFRLVKYVTFLLENYFPRHRALCRDEGALLRAALGGDARAVPALKALLGRVPEFRERCFAPPPQQQQ